MHRMLTPCGYTPHSITSNRSGATTPATGSPFISAFSGPIGVASSSRASYYQLYNNPSPINDQLPASSYGDVDDYRQQQQTSGDSETLVRKSKLLSSLMQSASAPRSRGAAMAQFRQRDKVVVYRQSVSCRFFPEFP